MKNKKSFIHHIIKRESFRPSHSNRDKRPSREEMKALHKEQREVILNAMMPVLTPEQQAIVKSIQADCDRGEVPAILVEKQVENFTKMKYPVVIYR